LKIKYRIYLSLEEEDKPEKPRKDRGNHESLFGRVEIDSKENKDTGAEGETKRAVYVVH
jgi:hypothetical protein